MLTEKAENMLKYTLTEKAKEILESLHNELFEKNGANGKISKEFVLDFKDKCNAEYIQGDGSVRFCILTTPLGTKFIGKAMVIDPENDVQEIGEKVALDDAANQLWGYLGSMAFLLEK